MSALDLVIRARNADSKLIHNVLLRTERDAGTLNPVSVLWRVLGPGNQGNGTLRDAVLLLGAESLEIYVTAEAEDEGVAAGPAGPARKVLNIPVTMVHIPRKLLSKARSSGIARTGSERVVEEDQELQDTGGTSEGALEGHVFSIGVAYSQLLRVRNLGPTITLWYHPNTISTAHLSKHPEAKALRFSFNLADDQEAEGVVRDLERQLERYAQAAIFLSRQLPFHQLIQMTSVTHLIPQGKNSTETVLLHAPAWETTAACPPQWSQDLSLAQDVMRVYLSTPFGAATASINAKTVLQFRQGDAARFYVSAHVASLVDQAPSPYAIKRHSRSESSLTQVPSFTEDSEESWQPDTEDSDDPPVQAQPTIASRAWQRGATPALDSSRAWQIRIHCFAQETATSVSGAASTTSPSGSGPPAGSLISPRYLWLAVLLAVVALGIGVSHSRLADLAALLSLAALIYSAVVSPSRKPGSATTGRSQPGHKGVRWSVTIIKAEFTRDEWQAVGPSLEMGASAQAAQAQEQQEESGVEGWAQKQLGLTPDQWQRYMVGFHQDEAEARKAAVATKEWRRANSLPEDASRLAQAHYDEIKSWFRHGVLCNTHTGHPVWMMKVGDMKKGWQKFKASGHSTSLVNYHIAFCMDYLYNHIDARELPDGRAIWIVDLKGMGMTDIGSDAFNFGKDIALTIGRHWPERVDRIFIVHVPGFFSLLWRIVEPMLAANTRRKIRLLRSRQDMLREMKEEMAEADIPSEYGGQSNTELYDTESELAVKHYVDQLAQ